MKTTQESSTTFDRVSTYEELHQVLALLGEANAPLSVDEPPAEPEDQQDLREAVSSLWHDSEPPEGTTETVGDLCPWAEIVPNERVN